MKLQQVLDKIKDIPALIDPIEVDELIDWVSGWIDELEMDLGVVDQQVSQKRLALIEEHKKVNLAERKLEVEEIYIKQQDIERKIRRLKSARSNLKRRYEIITRQALSRHL